MSVLCGFVWSLPARAYEEQASLDLAAGYTGVARADSVPPNGFALAAGGALGISDLFVLRAMAGYAGLFGHGDSAHIGQTRVELAYLLDVVQFVPFFGLGGSLWFYNDLADDFRVRPAGYLLIGVDYLWSRAWTVGFDFRTGILFEPGGGVASANELQLRISRMFDLF